RFSLESQSYLLRLANLGFMTRQQQERILDRLSMFSPRAVTMDQVKMITSAVLFDEYGDSETSSVGSNRDADQVVRIN
ncbi:MAG: DUF494 family protein, partial [candidate division Zixibacteria bacterium]|nr:DUF494 family protein [candidate division Zixibacteria bacterium]